MSVELGGADALLVIGDSERNADLYYATRFRAPDPFVFVWTRAEKILMVSNLELDRARAQAQVDRVLASAHYENLVRESTNETPSSRQVLLGLLRDMGLETLRVPADFPLEPADFLRQQGIRLDIAPAPLFPARQIKTPDEIDALGVAMRAAERGMAVAVEAIRAASVREGTLFLEGEALTSERLRRLIHLELMALDCTAQRTIVACGADSCDPHQEGRGPLRAGMSIIIDIFPRDNTSGYFGDITRTVVKGTAPAALRALYDAVQRGQQLALERVRAGAEGRQIHQAILDLFTGEGHETGEKHGHMQGFFHSTGHGLGLEIHEAPRIGPTRDVLEAGQVVTVEPGLYYPEVGGVRLEDVVVVEDGGATNLTTFPKLLEV